METYKEEFIDFLLRKNALKFGEFTLKSGRKSPYFVNTGCFDDGAALSELGHYYAARLIDARREFTTLFGPAYKGIALALAASIALHRDFSRTVLCSYDRKEIKDHGDKGKMVGYVPTHSDRVVILDDVFTTGETKEEAVKLLSSFGATIDCIVIAVDRCEKGLDGKNAIAEFTRKLGVPVFPIVTVREVISYLHNKNIHGVVHIDDRRKAQMEAYLRDFGVQ